MRHPWLLCALFAVLGCSVDVSAPCETDDNCPRTQHCGHAGHCLDGPTPIDLACPQMTKALQSRAASCLGGRADDFGLAVGTDALCSSIVSSVNAGRLAYDPSKLAGCTANLSLLPCSQISVASLVAQCAALTPTQAAGQACGSSFDCNDGWCDTSVSCVGLCKPLVHQGQGCAPADHCAAGTACAGGTCKPLGTANQACGGINDPPCDLGATYCDPVAKQCLPRRTSGACGIAVCAISPYAGCECALKFACVGTNLLGQGVCQQAQPIGAACQGQYECEFLSYCPSGVSSPTCQPDLHRGAGCGSAFAPVGDKAFCLGSRCANGTCSPYLNAGDSCASGLECGPTAHCSTVCKTDVCG